MYYYFMLAFVFFILSGVVAAAAWGTKTYGFSGIDPAFLGALIGAAGTIFAATIAYIAVQKQIDLAHLQVRLYARPQAAPPTPMLF